MPNKMRSNDGPIGNINNNNGMPNSDANFIPAS